MRTMQVINRDPAHAVAWVSVRMLAGHVRVNIEYLMMYVLCKTCRSIEGLLEVGCGHVREGIPQSPQMGKERLRQLLCSTEITNFWVGM